MDQHVVFQDMEDFLEELRFDSKEESVIENLVRVQIEKEPVNAAVTRFLIRAQYMTSEADLKEVRVDCGISPARVNSGDVDGAQEATQASAKLRIAMEDLEIQVRRGTWV